MKIKILVYAIEDDITDISRGFTIKHALLVIVYIYVTGEMDPSDGSVMPGPNLTSGMEPGKNTNI